MSYATKIIPRDRAFAEAETSSAHYGVRPLNELVAIVNTEIVNAIRAGEFFLNVGELLTPQELRYRGVCELLTKRITEAGYHCEYDPRDCVFTRTQTVGATGIVGGFAYEPRTPTIVVCL